MGVNRNEVRLIRANIVKSFVEELEFKRFSDLYYFCWEKMRTGMYKPDDALLIYTEAGLYDASWIQDYYAIFCGDVTTVDAATQSAAKSIDAIDSSFDTDNMDMDRLSQVFLGLKHGLASEDIHVYARNEFDAYQMDEIFASIEKGLPKDTIGIIANAKLSPWHMNELSCAFEDGMSMEQLQRLADENLSWMEVNAIKEENRLENLFPTKLNRDNMQEVNQERSVDYDF